MTGLRGFGVTVDLTTGRMRNWYAGSDGIRRWVDTDQPVDPTEAALSDAPPMVYRRVRIVVEDAK